MSLEDEMRNEMRKLEREIDFIDRELEKLHAKIVQLIMLRKKKDRDMHILKSNFGEETEDDREIQTTLAKLLKEKI